MNYYDTEFHRNIKLFNISEKLLKEIINETFIEYNIHNEDMFDEKDYNNIKSVILDLYNNIHSSSNKSEDYSDILDDVIDELLLLRISERSPNYSENDISELTDKIKYLDTLEQPEQRTPEWYEFRQNRITASDFGIAYDMNPYTDKNKIILKKCGHEEPFVGNSAIKHGVKYEDVAIKIYEQRNNVSVSEYGCISHPTVPFIGASPDGICNYNSKNKNYIGRMLEIKCPKSRKLDGFVPPYYFLQVQGQLETCELEYCDFLECIIKEYNNRDEFMNDVKPDCNHNYRECGMEKGVLIELYDIDNNKSIYSYAAYKNCLDEVSIQKWEESIFKHCEENKNLEYIGITYWKLTQYSCILVKRDKELWNDMVSKLQVIWDKILYHRDNGVDDILKLKKQRKNKNDVSFGKEYNVAFLDDD